jgi:hypothetical protein
MPPQIRHIVNLWSLVGHPNPKRPWSLERQIAAVKEAGFDGFTTQAGPQHRKLAGKHGLIIVGYFASSKISEFSGLLRSQQDAGAHYINVQMGDHDTLTPQALKMALALFKAADKLGVEPSIEVHRDVCTETPEKTYALTAAFKKATGRLLPLTWDFSHLAVVKHLRPGNYSERLLTHPALIQRAEQLHCRPFNGHHAQVPVTDGHGRLTPEVKDYLAFVEDLFRLWLKGKQDGREVFVVPEMGPVPSGYNISTWPSSWEDAVRLRVLLDKLWKKALKA